MPPRPSPRPAAPKRRPAPAFVPNNLVFFVLALMLVVVAVQMVAGGLMPTLPYSDFLNLADGKELKKVTFVGTDRLVGELRDPQAVKLREELKSQLQGGKFTTMLPPGNDIQGAVARSLREKDPAVQIDTQQDTGVWLGSLVLPLLMFGLVLAVMAFVILPRVRDPIGGGFINNYVKSPARRFDAARGRVTFEDVASMESAKRELQEVVEFLKSPEKFTRLGAQIPKGVLLIGPPGTGKTLLARAVAGEANVPFFSINGSEFIQMFVGVGASRVRDMFKTAKESAPCLIFIDEIDAVGRMRGAGVGGGSDEREQTLNQILSEMDGFTPNETVIVIAATNRPDVLDSALLRPGRFDRHVTVDKPTWKGRLAILKVHTRNKPLGDDVNLEKVAREMTGMSGADLRNLCNEAAILATRENKNKLEQADFNAAADRVLIGPKREEMFTAKERRRTAYHEAGHALCSVLQPDGDPVFKLTIIPRGGAAGMVRYTPNEDRVDYTRTQLMAKLVSAMGGRAADRLIFNDSTSGASQDLKQATRIARMMVAQFGLSDRVGPMACKVGEEHMFLGKEIQESRDFSEGTAQVIDEEVQKILREADDAAYELLRQHRPEMERIVEALLDREEIDRAELEALLDPQNRPAPADAEPAEELPVILTPQPSLG